MIDRRILFAGLFSVASLAQAGTVATSAATVQPAWALNGGLNGSAGLSASQSMIAGPGTWSAHSRLGDIGASSTMLFSHNGPALGATARAGGTPPPAQLGSTTQAPPPEQPVSATPAPPPEQPVSVTQAPPPEQLVSTTHEPAPQEAAAPVFTESAAIVADIEIAAPAPAEIAAIVVNADAIAEAPAALAAVPEPATGLLMLAGLLGAGLLRRRS